MRPWRSGRRALIGRAFVLRRSLVLGLILRRRAGILLGLLHGKRRQRGEADRQREDAGGNTVQNWPKGFQLHMNLQFVPEPGECVDDIAYLVMRTST